ncbi:MAG TPA: hypothetical protein K8V11_11890 [Dietzia timorensis]|uniref:Transmembrane protein n=1 Tax=Dietzia timorensis TaxID=499555 RepID=A0A921F510_9ACTN|nr:hypothetical protein [Dietzia timorensis]HJE91696.1 hypothetical protein [Dietzia timorensis]
MTSDARLIDSYRVGLYALPLPAFALLAVVVFWLVGFLAATALTEWDPGIDFSLRGSFVYAVIVGAVLAGGSIVGEHSRRKKFVDAQDRAEYHRAVDHEVLPDDGAPMHWRERMLTEIAERSRAYLSAVILVVAMGLVTASMMARGGEWPLLLAAVGLCAALGVGLFLQVQRSKKAKRLYAASNPRMTESAR